MYVIHYVIYIPVTIFSMFFQPAKVYVSHFEILEDL